MSNNPLKCPICSDFRYLKLDKIVFRLEKKSCIVRVPFYECPSCLNKDSIEGFEQYKKLVSEYLEKRDEGEYEITFEYENLQFEEFEYLEFTYSSEDYFLIPGLYRGDGYLTPVFFDKDVLLWYNNHPDYEVRFTSFSSGNIYTNGESLFYWGFGINRNGKIFKWLGDLARDFREEKMKPHLKRFQASNIASDHDIYSKFYLSQIPSTPEEAFQRSDNESRIFHLKNKLEQKIKEISGLKLTKIDIHELSQFYKPPILEEKEQIFNAYVSLNKYLIENIQVSDLKGVLKKNGISSKELKGLGSLKLLEMYFRNILNLEDIDVRISPLYVLNDLRQLQSHLSIEGYEKRYNFCKKRLDLPSEVDDFEVYQKLVSRLIEFYQGLIESLN